MAALPAIMMIASAASQVGSGIGGMVQSNREARQMEEIGRIEAAERRREGRKIAGRQRAGFGKAGVRTDVGTPLEVLMETAETTELNALRERFKARTAASARRSQGRMALGQSLISAAGSAYGAYKAWPATPQNIPVSSSIRAGRPPAIAQPRGRYFP